MITDKKAKHVLKCVIKKGESTVAQEMDVSVETVRRYCRVAFRLEQEVEVAQPSSEEQKPVLIISDMHAPYQHPDAIEFLKWVQESRGCRERVVSVGDMWDFHSMSFHKSEPDSISPEEEYALIKEFSAEFAKVFPYGDVVLGNHCDIPKRKMVDSGLAPSMLRESNELYGLPDTWTIHPMYYVIEPFDVLVEHGQGSGGRYGCANTSKEKRCSYVQGHTHSSAAVIYSTNHVGTIFGMNVGCLIDSSSYAFRYGKYTTRKGNIGCGVVYNGSHAEFVPIESWPGFKG